MSGISADSQETCRQQRSAVGQMIKWGGGCRVGVCLRQHTPGTTKLKNGATLRPCDGAQV